MTKLISLERLKLFLTDLKAWVKDYFESMVDSDFSNTSKNPLQNKTVTNKFAKVSWRGTKDQLQAAIESGEIEPGFTVVTIIDDEETIAYEICSIQDIYSLFGLVYSEA